MAEAIRAGGPVRRIFAVPDASDAVRRVVGEARAHAIEVVAVTEPVLARLSTTVTPQGVVAVVGFVDGPIQTIGSSAEKLSSLLPR